MYNAHRGMVPAGGPNNRLNDLLEQIRHEFENSAGRAVEYEGQRTFAFSITPPDRCTCIASISRAFKQLHVAA